MYKDAYPVNQPGTITISSSYSKNLTFGRSTSIGFSFGDGLSVEEGGSVSQSIAYSYSKSYTTTEPALTAQKDPDNQNKYSWLYIYNTRRRETNHLDTGYIFEMNNKNHDLLEGDVAIVIDYSFTIYKLNWSFGPFVNSHTETISGSELLNYY